MRLSFPHPHYWYEVGMLKVHEHEYAFKLVKTAGCYNAYVCMVITYRKRVDQHGKVANPAHGQLNRKMKYSLTPENLVSRNGFGRPVPRQPAHSPHPG